MTARAAEVLVVGAGPAGSVLAGILSRRGRDVLLVDRSTFPRPKPCGECLNPDAVRLLGTLGLLHEVRRARPAALEGWTIRSRSERAAGGYGDPELQGLALPRTELDRRLLHWARQGGARIAEGVRVTETDAGDRGRAPTVRVRTGGARQRSWSASVVVGADGLRSVVARSAGLLRRGPRLRKLSLTCHLEGRGPDPRRGHLFVDGGRLLGLAPVTPAGDRWNATVVVDADRYGREVAGGPESFHRAAVRSFAVPWRGAPRWRDGPWASGPFDRPCRRASRGRVLLVGDAAGYYDPLTGQGIRRALLSASAAAWAVDRALGGDGRGHTDLRPLRVYGKRIPKLLAPGRRVQKIVEFVVSRPRLLDAALRMTGRREDGLTPLLRVTGDVAPARSLLDPVAWVARPSRGSRKNDGRRGA